ncbi:unnamed protein product [Ilex paraguariensis]|uniref:Uncharacterized protein n=1 Tax=Ilex paraguariensis TaxID=185542 RepID=A0ABC8TLN0_9AQUA
MVPEDVVFFKLICRKTSNWGVKKRERAIFERIELTRVSQAEAYDTKFIRNLVAIAPNKEMLKKSLAEKRQARLVGEARANKQRHLGKSFELPHRDVELPIFKEVITADLPST